MYNNEVMEMNEESRFEESSLEDTWFWVWTPNKIPGFIGPRLQRPLGPIYDIPALSSNCRFRFFFFFFFLLVNQMNTLAISPSLKEKG